MKFLKTVKQIVFVTALATIAAYPMTGYAWKSSGHTWKTNRVTYYVNPANADMPEDAAITAIQKAAAAWTDQTSANFSFAYGGRTTGSSFAANGKNEVFFRNTANGSLVAEAYRWYNAAGDIIDSDIVFYDGGWKFTTTELGTCVGSMVLENFATHEFGHMLGLTHSTVTRATMSPSDGKCSTKWISLDTDDIAGVESLYPPVAPANTPPTVSVTSPRHLDTVADGTAFTFDGSAMDKEDGNISTTLQWTSNLDGVIGTGASFTRTLSVGTHTLTVSAHDTKNADAQAVLTVTVNAAATDGGTGTGPGDATAAPIVLDATKVQKSGVWKTQLTWSGATGTRVRILRNDVLLVGTENDGAQLDASGITVGQSYTYQVCEKDGPGCSAPVTVVF